MAIAPQNVERPHVAGPSFHANLSKLDRLWEIKSSIAIDRPFSATEDIHGAALDSLQGFVFGQGFRHSTTEPKIRTLLNLGEVSKAALLSGDWEEPIDFPMGGMDLVIKATLDISASVEELKSFMAPGLRFKFWISKKPCIRHALATRDDFVRRQLTAVVTKMHITKDAGLEPQVHSAVDYMVHQNQKLTEKDNKKPDFFSGTMKDESFGMITTGHDTRSTTMLWALKFLADRSSAQHSLRADIQAACATAAAERRDPAIEEITGSHIPLPDATLEESFALPLQHPASIARANVSPGFLGISSPREPSSCV